MRAKRFLLGLRALDSHTRDGKWLQEGLEMFLRVCQNSEQISIADSVNGKIAWGYVQGVLDATNRRAFQPPAAESAPTDCESKDRFYAPVAQTGYPTSGLQAHEYAQLILNYVNAHLDQSANSASDLIAAALFGHSHRSQK